MRARAALVLLCAIHGACLVPPSVTFVSVDGSDISLADGDAAANDGQDVPSDGTDVMDALNDASDVIDAFGDAGDVPIDTSSRPTGMQLRTSGTSNCVLLRDGGVSCWGERGFMPESPVGFDPLVDMQLGVNNLCGKTRAGTLECLGDNSRGQLAVSPSVTPSTSVAIPVMTPPLSGSWAVGFDAMFALDHLGEILAWGYNDASQLGRGSADGMPHPDPMPVGTGTPFTGATQVSAGYRHACVVDSMQHVACWGTNVDGQLGTGSDEVFPTVVAGVPTVSQVACVYDQSFVITTTGQVWGWGYNDFGQVRPMGPVMQTPAPLGLPAGRTARAIAPGGIHTCALLDNGDVACWGRNVEGELGAGDAMPHVINQIPAAALGHVVAITAGSSMDNLGHTCVLRDDDTVLCWGNNSYGELGFPHTGYVASPAVSTPVRF